MKTAILSGDGINGQPLAVQVYGPDSTDWIVCRINSGHDWSVTWRPTGHVAVKLYCGTSTLQKAFLRVVADHLNGYTKRIDAVQNRRGCARRIAVALRRAIDQFFAGIEKLEYNQDVPLYRAAKNRAEQLEKYYRSLPR